MTMLSSMGIGEAGVYALLGYAVVFFGLVVPGMISQEDIDMLLLQPIHRLEV